MLITDKIEKINRLVEHIPLPKMIQIEQHFDDQKLVDYKQELLAELNKEAIKTTIKPGMRIAITAGSRGIANMSGILQGIVEFVKSLGGQPFIIPAMGSHGGATSEGQKALLAGYGITEENIKAPIKAIMEVQAIGQLDNGLPVYIDKYASEADGIIVVNRIKPHTSFRGKYESGLLKMAVIGLGKQKGAEACHSKGFADMANMVERLGSHIILSGRVLFGVAILENAFDETRELHALLPGEIIDEEPTLLEKAKSFMPRILFPACDVLVIDYIGKNFSGPGADPNITGAFATDYASGGLKNQSLVVLDLSEESHGNANGIGVADVTTRQLFEKFDMVETYPNALTSTLAANAKFPMVMSNHKAAIQAGAKFAMLADPNNLRLIRIRDTLHLKNIWISEALLPEVLLNNNITVCTEASEMIFDEAGNLF